MSLAGYAGVLGVSLLVMGCARKHPGPAECRAFALAAVGVPATTPASLLERRPDLSQRAEEITRKCLTTPWDYDLLGCLQGGGDSQLCLRRFKVRRLGDGSPTTPRY